MTDPFEDLDQSVAEEAEETVERTDGAGGSTHPDQTETAHSTERTETPEPTEVAEEDTRPKPTTEGASGALDKPAFDFDPNQQRDIYVRDEEWTEFVDALDFDVKRALRDEGVEDISKRELHTYALAEVTEHAEAIAERIVEARRE